MHVVPMSLRGHDHIDPVQVFETLDEAIAEYRAAGAAPVS